VSLKVFDHHASVSRKWRYLLVKGEKEWNRREEDELRKLALQELFTPAVNKLIEISLRDSQDIGTAYRCLKTLYGLGSF
jgi:hypothetical protein